VPVFETGTHVRATSIAGGAVDGSIPTWVLAAVGMLRPSTVPGVRNVVVAMSSPIT
jgi:hypothetical protein